MHFPDQTPFTEMTGKESSKQMLFYAKSCLARVIVLYHGGGLASTTSVPIGFQKKVLFRHNVVKWGQNHQLMT